MANKTLLGYDNLPDRGPSAVTGSGWRANLPVSNVAHAHIAKFAKLTGSSGTIKVDAGSDETARALAFIGTNMDSSVSYTLKVDPDGGSFGNGNAATRTDTHVFDTTYQQMLDDFGSDITGRYWQIDVSGLSGLKVGRLVIVPAQVFHIVYPLDIGIQDNTMVKRTEGGQTLRFRKSEPRQATFNYQLIGPTSRTDALGGFVKMVDRLSGKFSDVLFVPNPGDSDLGINQMIWGQIQELGPASFVGFQQFEKTYRVIEAN